MPLHPAGWVDSESGARPACSLTPPFSLSILTTNEIPARPSIRLFFGKDGMAALLGIKFTMKYSTALMQSKACVRFLLVAVPCMWALFFWLHHWALLAFAAFMSLYLLMDAWNIWKIKKAAKEDPDILKKKLPGT